MNNRAPVTKLKVTGNPYVGEVIRIDATESEDLDGIIKAVVYQLGNGEEFKSKKPGIVEAKYTEPGLYDITVIIKDNKGFIGSDKVQIGILQIGPTIVMEDQSASFNSPSGGPITVTYPPTPEASGGVAPYTYEYSKQQNELFPIGTTDVTIIARDSVGNTGTAILTIIVISTFVPPDPPQDPIVITPPSNQSVVSPDGSSVSRSWLDAGVTGGTAPYSIVYRLNGISITSPHNFPVADNIITIDVTDSLGFQQHSSFHIAVSYNPIPPPSVGNEWYDNLAARPDNIFTASLRTSANISLYNQENPNQAIAFYDAAVDACRVTLLQDTISINQFLFPIFQSAKGKTTCYIEFMFSGNWALLGNFQHKFFNIRLGTTGGTGGGGNIWFEPDIAYSRTNGLPSKPNCANAARGYQRIGPVNGTFTGEYGSVAYNPDQIYPVVQNYFFPLNKWCRAMMEVDQSTGEFDISYCTLAYTDETHAPTIQILRGQQHNGVSGTPDVGRPRIFNIEVNSSSTRVGPEVYMWFRNVNVLRNVADSFALLTQPTT